MKLSFSILDDMIKEGSNHSFNSQRENSKASKSDTRNLAYKKDLQHPKHDFHFKKITLIPLD